MSPRRRPLVALLAVCLLLAGAAGIVAAEEITYEPNQDGTFVVYTYEGPESEQRQPGTTDRSYWTESVLEEIPKDEDVYLLRSVTYRPLASDCSPSDTEVFGIDRGNTYEGERKADEDIKDSVKSFSQDPEAREQYRSEFDDPEPLSTADGVQYERLDIEWYGPDDFGSPVRLSRGDRFLSAQSGCMDNPDKPGWYRWASYNEAELENGTRIVPEGPAYSDWYYICDCANREEAVETLGPPPGEETETPTPTAAETGDDTPTATAEAGASTETSDESPASDDETPAPSTETPTTATPTETSAPTPTPTVPADWDERVVQTPTAGDGAGPSSLLALFALVLAACLRRRR